MMISCKTATGYISKKEEGKLTFYQKFQLKLHLAICYVCKIFEKQNKQITSIFKSSTNREIEVLKPSDKKEIITALEEIS